MTVFAKVLGAQVRQLTLARDDVDDADLALRQFLHEKVIPPCDMLCARNVGTVANVLSIYNGTLPKLLSKPSSSIMLEQNTAFSFIARATPTSSASIEDCAVSPYSPTLKLIGALANITMYDEVDQPLSGFLPQLASENEATLKSPYL